MGESMFTFDDLLVGTAGTFSSTVNGLTATFQGSATVCATTGLNGNLFTTLSGNALMQGFCTATNSGPLTINFNHYVLRLNFALAVNGTESVPVTVQYFDRGTKVGEQTITPTVPANGVSPEAAVSYTGTFDSVQISSAGLIAIDNLDATPTPASPFGTLK